MKGFHANFLYNRRIKLSIWQLPYSKKEIIQWVIDIDPLYLTYRAPYYVEPWWKRAGWNAVPNAPYVRKVILSLLKNHDSILWVPFDIEEAVCGTKSIKDVECKPNQAVSVHPKQSTAQGSGWVMSRRAPAC